VFFCVQQLFDFPGQPFDLAIVINAGVERETLGNEAAIT